MNKKNMKKYFMQGTAEELKFGDMIVLDLTEDMPNGKVKHHHLECKFVPELVDTLLDEGVIDVEEVETKEEKEGENTLDFQDEENCPMIDELIAANQNLEHRVYSLEKEVKDLKVFISDLKKRHKNAKKAI